jgi:hypothetical protein
VLILSVKQGHAKKLKETCHERKHIVLRKMLFASASAAIVALSSMTIHATAASSISDGKHWITAEAAHFATHRAHAARREFVRDVSNAGPAYGALPQIVNTHREPGYVYAPGRGIVDEACNLPTSSCPDWQRDVP